MNCIEMSDKGQLVLQFCNKYLPRCMVLLATFIKKLRSAKIRKCRTRMYDFLIGV